MSKLRQEPEFRIIKRKEANAKFFVASGTQFVSSNTVASNDAVTTYSQVSTSGWF